MKQNNNQEPKSGTEYRFNEGNRSDSDINSVNYQEKTIPVIEEKVNIDKRWVETGKVNISKTVSDQEEIINVPLVHEEVNIERIEVNQYVDSLPPPVRYEGDTMIIPVLKEVVVKRVMVVEEIRVTKKEVQTHNQQHVTLKKEEIEINRSGSSENSQ